MRTARRAYRAGGSGSEESASPLVLPRGSESEAGFIRSANRLPSAYAIGADSRSPVMASRGLVAGATRVVGGRLASAVVREGWEVGGMVRDRAGSRARELERTGVGLHEGDVLRPESLRGAGEGVSVAYYLIHSMGRGGGRDF